MTRMKEKDKPAILPDEITIERVERSAERGRTKEESQLIGTEPGEEKEMQPKAFGKRGVFLKEKQPRPHQPEGFLVHIPITGFSMPYFGFRL